MCQYTVPNDEIDDSQKGKSPVTRRVMCCFQDRNSVFYLYSITDIVRYMYIKMLQKSGIFTGPQSNDICKML